MESHRAEYQRFHEDYQNTEEESMRGNRRRRDASEHSENAHNQTGSHTVREFIKFELSDAKVPDKETEMYIQKQRALKDGNAAPKKKPTERMSSSESQQVMRYGSPRSGRSPARYEVYNQNSATKTPFKIVVPEGKPTQYKVYGSPSYNYPRYQQQQQQQQTHQYSVEGRNYYGEKVNNRGFRNGKKLSDYPNKQWWLPIKKQRKRPQQQKLEQYSQQYDEPQELNDKNQYITLLQSNQLPTSYMIQGIGGSTPSPMPKFAAVIYKETPTYYYTQTQTPKPITEDHGRYYVNAYGQPVLVEDVQIQTSEPDKHLGTKNEYVPIGERKVPFKQQYAPETSTQASISALSSLIGKRPSQQLQGLTQLLDLDRPQDSTSPVQFEFETPTTQLPPRSRVFPSSTVSTPRKENVNIQYYQPNYETVVETNPISSLSQEQLNAVYNDLVQRHRNQEQRNARPPPSTQRLTVSTTARPQYYQYTTPQPVVVSHSSVTVRTPSDVSHVQESQAKAPLPIYSRRPSNPVKSYPPASASVAITSTSYHGGGREEEKVSTRNRNTISHKIHYRKRLASKARKTQLHELTPLTPTTTRPTTATTKHNIHKRDLLWTRPKRRLTRQGLLVRPRSLTVPTPSPPTTKVPIINPYEHDFYTISVDDFANAFDPEGLKEAYDAIGNQDIPTNPFATTPIEDRQQKDFYDLEDLEVDEKAPSYLRQTVLNLRHKNNDFLRTINAAIMYNDQNEEKAYKALSRKNGKSLRSGSMRKFDAILNESGSEEVEQTDEELKQAAVESKLISTLQNYIRRDPVKEQLLREVAEQINRQREQEKLEKEVKEEDVTSSNEDREQRRPARPTFTPPPHGRRRTKRDTFQLPFHNESTPYLGKDNVYTKTLTDPEAIHYNGTHSTDHSFDYNDDFVEEENATLSVDYQDFFDYRIKNLTNAIAARSDYYYAGDDEDEDSVNDYYSTDNKHYNHKITYALAEDNHQSETRYPNPYKSQISPHEYQMPGQKFKLVPVTVFKKVPIEPDYDESLHIDNVNIFEGHSNSVGGGGYRIHQRPRRPPKKYRNKHFRWGSRPRRRYHHHRKPTYKRRGHLPHSSKLRKKFPKIKWLLGH